MTSSTPGGHVASAEVSRYAAGHMTADDETLLEDHLLGCTAGRQAVTTSSSVDEHRLAVVWEGVVDQIDRPRVSVAERLLRWCGARPETARLVVAAPSLRAPWLAAVAACLLLSMVAAAGSVRGTWLFLTLAPLLPVGGVVAAYGPHSDPAWELARSTQYSLARLAFLRAVAVLASTVPIAALVGALLPNADWWICAVWLLPALTFVLASVWLGTYVRPLPAAVTLAVGWLAVTTSATARRVDPDVLLRPGVQAGFAVAVVLTAVGVWSRRGVVGAGSRA